MAYKCFITSASNGGVTQTFLAYNGVFLDLSNNQLLDAFAVVLYFGVDLITYSQSEIHGAIQTQIMAESALQGFGIATTDIIYSAPNLAWPKTYTNNPSRSIVTGTGATGFQISATRETDVRYSPTLVTTASIAGSVSDVIVLEICATNSATAGNWQEIARITNGQALTLAIALQSVQTTSGQFGGLIPAGWYVKMRAITSGTVTNSFSSGQEVLV